MVNKYRAIKMREDGFVFDSKKEHARYCQLKMLAMAGEIGELTIHPQYPIAVNGNRICTVELDFFYIDKAGGNHHHEDVKGFDTALSKLKRKLVEASYSLKVEVL